MVTNGITALVVDDDPDVVRVAAAMLGMLGYTVRTADQGADALFHFQRAPCALVLTGYNMPIINGYQLSRKIKFQAPDTRVLIMTGSTRAEVAGLMKDAGIDGWLFKPFLLEELRTVLVRFGLPVSARKEPVQRQSSVSLPTQHNERGVA